MYWTKKYQMTKTRENLQKQEIDFFNNFTINADSENKIQQTQIF